MLTPSPNGARWPEPEPLANPGRFNLANRYFGILFHCLQHRISYDETKAFPTPTKIAA
jgi:hypothetical protein